MNEKLPDGWEWKKLEDIGTYINGRAFKPSEWSTKGKPIVRIQNLTDESKPYNCYEGECESRYQLKNGDILVSWSASLGVFVWNGGDAVLNQHIFKAMPNEDVIDTKYFVLALKRVIGSMDRLTHGSTMKHIIKSDFNNTIVPLPPLDVQQKIVSILEKAEETKRLRAQADELTQQLLKSVFLGMFGDSVQNKKGWNVVQLKDVTTKITDGVHSKPIYVTNGVPFISVVNVTKERLSFDNCKYISEDAHKEYFKRCNPEKNDILYTKVGATYGIASIVDTSMEFSLYVSVALIKPKHEKINYAFLKYLMNSSDIKNQANKSIKGIGVPDLHLIEIKKFNIILPPLSLQQEFAAIVEQAEKMREQQAQSSQQINTLFDSLMQKAFTGELVS